MPDLDKIKGKNSTGNLVLVNMQLQYDATYITRKKHYIIQRKRV